MQFVRISLLAVMFLVSASVSQGIDIAAYDFTGATGSQTVSSPTFVDPLFSYYDIMRNTGLVSGANLANSINSTIDYTAAATDRYYMWWGYKNDYAPWDFDFVRTGYQISTGSGTLPTQVNLAYSLDSGSTYTDLGTLNLTGTSGDLDFTFANVNVPVNSYFGSAFKLSVIGGSGTDTTFALTNGSFGGLKVGVAVPEPSTYALGAIASGLLAVMARRRKLNQAR